MKFITRKTQKYEIWKCNAYTLHFHNTITFDRYYNFNFGYNVIGRELLFYLHLLNFPKITMITRLKRHAFLIVVFICRFTNLDNNYKDWMYTYIQYKIDQESTNRTIVRYSHVSQLVCLLIYCDKIVYSS